MLDYPDSKTQPWQHQIEAWKRIQQFSAYYLMWEMGAGKSKTVVDTITGLNAKNTLIICPHKVMGVWPRQFEIHSALNISVHVMNNGTKRTKAAEIEQRLRFSGGKPQVFVVNYESCFGAPMGPTLNKRRQIISPGVLLKHAWNLLVLDEAHRIKSPGGRASWQCYRLGKRNYRKLFLSGTPMPHSPLDIYGQYRALDFRIFNCNFTQFRARYAIMGGYLNKQIFEYQNIEDMNRRIFKIAYEVLVDDIPDIDLPPKSDHELYFDLKPETMAIYKSLEKDLIAEWEHGKMVAQNVLVKLLRLSELTCGIATKEDGSKSIIDTSKVDRIVDFLEDIPLSEPIVIYCKFIPELYSLKKAISKTRSVAEVSGRADELELWQNGHRNTIILQIDAGSEGIDLTRAKYCIYSSTGLKLGIYRQSRKRIHRPGQNRKVLYYHVLGNGTVDIANLRALKEKREVVDFFLRGLHDYKKTMIAPKTRRIRDLALSQLLEEII